MTTLTDTQVITASGGLVELGYSQITTSQIIVTSTTAGAGDTIIPSLTVVCDGSPVLVEFFCPQVATPNSAGVQTYTTLNYDGSERVRFWGLCTSPASSYDDKPQHLQYRMTPTAGSHTFSVTAYNSAVGNAFFKSGGSTNTPAPTFLRVSKIVQATQWPAVTTGTIICTSTTRPAAPFAGQRIYETDSKRSWTYTNSQWVPDDMIFTNEAARDAAITSPTEGMRAYLTAPTIPAATGSTTAIPTGITTIYNGSVWVCVTEIGASSTTSGSTTSATYVTTLTGDATAISTTLVTGTTALVSISATMQNNTNAVITYLGVGVTGAGTVAAADGFSAYMNHNANYWSPAGFTRVLTGLTAGTNTFTLSYRVQSNTGTYNPRGLVVRGIA